MLIIYSILFIIVFIYLLLNKKYQNFLVQPTSFSVVKKNIPTFATQLTNLEGEQASVTPDKTGFNERINAIYKKILDFIIGAD
jgi:Na+-transporting methylmalonyl-CoA/oxaloacetate decarboxylase beta subunit